MKYSIAALRQKWDALPNKQVIFSKRETGWAKDLGAGRVAIANTPLEPRLHCMDVVTIAGGIVGNVVWRAYARKTWVDYPASDGRTARRNFERIVACCREHQLPVEGLTLGSCGINHHAGTDLGAVLAESNVEGIVLRDDWKEPSDG